MGIWKELKKRPAVLIGLGFAIIAVLYIVYKSNNSNSTASGTNSQTGTNGQGTAGQLGGYIQFEEEVMNPPNVNVTLSGGTSKGRTPVVVNVNEGGHKTHIKTPVPPPKVHNTRAVIAKREAHLDRLDSHYDKVLKNLTPKKK